jgi:Ca-activated chloride channel family protein
MRFAEPYWLSAGAVVVVLLFGLRVRAERLTKRAIDTLSGARLINAGTLPSPFRRWLRVFVTCVAVAAGFVALARPQKGKEWQTLDRKGTDLLLVIDTSKSMNTDDVSPTRLERTKLSVRDLVARFPEDRIGLMAFAGDAYLESPLTLDHSALLETLSTFDTSIIPRPGTDIGRAIDSAVHALKADSGSQKVMVLLSDGEDLRGQALDAAKRAAATGITIDTVGVGTPAGELVPAKNEQGATIGIVRDENGTPVRSRLDESGLRAIAQATHGTYRPLGADGAGLDRLYAESLAPLSHLEKGTKLQRVYAEWFALPLGLSLLALAFDALLGWRPRARPRSRTTSRSARVAQGGALAAAALLTLVSGSAHASVQSAEKAYNSNKFAESAQQYDAELMKNPKDARIAVDAAAAAYRTGHFDAAETTLNKALRLADPKLQERVLYDLGDARYRLGATTLKDAPEKTIERWKAAIDSYDGALKLTPNDADARFNRDFVKRKLAELENQQKNKPQEQPSKQNQKQGGGQSDKNEKNKNGGSAGQGQKGDSSNQGKDGTPKSSDQKGNQSAKPEDGKNGQAGDKPGKDAENGQADDKQDAKGTEPTKPGTNGPPQDKPGAMQGTGGKSGDQSGKDAAPGTLSAREARALLGSLRGDEQHVRFGNNTQHSDDTPQKDW